MIQLVDLAPSLITLDGLKKYQDKIVGSFEVKKNLVKRKSAPGFSSYNKKGNKVFDVVKKSLTEMCSGAKRCAYCEDAPADEVEHIFPKDLFPDLCFVWSNYLYACGTCNGPKNNKFAIIRHDNQEIVHLDGSIEPPIGQSLLINPRIEDPLLFCKLNFISFHFEILHPENTINYQRADYTINMVLRLNDQREYLRVARENAYGMYMMRLHYYQSYKNSISDDQKNGMITQLQKEAHRSVWKEMQRCYIDKSLWRINRKLFYLFKKNPEALTW